MKPSADEAGHELFPAADAEMGVKPLDVFADGPDGEAQFEGDALGGLPDEEAVEDLPEAGRQLVDGVGGERREREVAAFDELAHFFDGEADEVDLPAGEGAFPTEAVHAEADDSVRVGPGAVEGDDAVLQADGGGEVHEIVVVGGAPAGDLVEGPGLEGVVAADGVVAVGVVMEGELDAEVGGVAEEGVVVEGGEGVVGEVGAIGRAVAPLVGDIEEPAVGVDEFVEAVDEKLPLSAWVVLQRGDVGEVAHEREDLRMGGVGATRHGFFLPPRSPERGCRRQGIYPMPGSPAKDISHTGDRPVRAVDRLKLFCCS